MIKIKNVEVFGWEAAIRGMRNPMNSWDMSDSLYLENTAVPMDGRTLYSMGENDLKLMKNLSKAGNDHGKFLRMITVAVDITAPLYWWKEYDTYKVGTVANSCSTMHKITEKEFTLEDFSCEHLLPIPSQEVLNHVIDALNVARTCYLGCIDVTAKKDWWWQIIQLLPSSYNQRRTVQLNYQVLKSMYHARKNHKLNEWRELCEWMENLPYFKEICVDE